MKKGKAENCNCLPNFKFIANSFSIRFFSICHISGIDGDKIVPIISAIIPNRNIILGLIILEDFIISIPLIIVII